MTGRNPFRWNSEGQPQGEEAARIQREIDATMREVLRKDARHDPHSRKSPIPEPTRPEPVRGTGWQPERKLEPPAGIDLIDQMVTAHLGPVNGKRKPDPDGLPPAA
jgi:hypothetical protein